MKGRIWRSTALPDKKLLAEYDPLLDKHCMITKTEDFMDKYKLLIKGQYEVGVACRKEIPERWRMLGWFPPITHVCGFNNNTI